MLNHSTIAKLIELHKEDLETIDFIYACIDSFERYHRAVFEDQMFVRVYGTGALDGETYRERRTAVDHERTIRHNTIIANVGILNRMAANAGLAPVYDGVVSKERPERRLLADAVFAYVESIIQNRT